MRYVSTRGTAPVLGFDDVLLEGLARDGGLYVPEEWPAFDVPDGAYHEVAAAVIRPFIGSSVLVDRLEDTLERTYAAFRHPEVAPLREIAPGRYLLELFWGPTLSFKDYALQFVGAAFEHVLRARQERVTVLGATSGDTGSAAIEALQGRSAVDVVILFPEGRISDVQRRQMTTVDAANVRAVAVAGSFDDCQDLVKQAFSSPEMRSRYRLAAVNSINWARVMAQAAYYAWTWRRLGEPFDVSVPTGNFGNVFAAEVARRGGVPIRRLIVGTNSNHGLVDIIESGRVVTSEVVATIAPAMDIQVPSNFERLLFELVGRNAARVDETMRLLRSEGAMALDEVAHRRLRERFSGHWYDRAAIEEAIAEVYATTSEVLDPHTAIGWMAAGEETSERPVVSVATAHPAKFPDSVERAVGFRPELPPDLRDLLTREERLITVGSDLADVDRVLKELPRS